MVTVPLSRRCRVVAIAAAASGLATSCGNPLPAAPTPATEAVGAFQAADVRVNPPDHSRGVRLDSPVTIRALGGRLQSVRVHQDGDPTDLPGHLSTNRRSWTSTEPLDPRSHYTVEVAATSPGGDMTTSRTSFSTLSANRLTTSATPGDGDTVGVGMPLTLRFNADIPSDRQNALLGHISVQTTPFVAGSWHWFTSSEVHWRPQELWPSGTRVTVNAKLRGFQADSDHWGLGDWSSSFTIGEKHVSVVDTASHQMVVYQNDQPVQSWPISAGRPGRDTLNGTLVVLYKTPDVLMDSLSIGIPRTSPDGYYDHVFWDTAISVDGFFIHAAPWSEPSQGSANVSHGCVNLSPDRAQAFYAFSQVGDVVVVRNSPRQADFGDGEGDWQITADQYANSGGSIPAPPTHNVPGGL